MIACLCRRKKNKQRKEEVDIPGAVVIPGGEAALNVAEGECEGEGEGERRSLVFFGNAEQVFDFDDLVRASALGLYEGSFGPSGKVYLDVGHLFVKRLSYVKISETEFAEMLDTVGNLSHENLLPLKAYYYSKDQKLLIYDYMPTGSLATLLQRNQDAGKKKTPLNWETRVSIALGVARAITYLHSQGTATFHGNIKPSNILLTTSLEPRLSDYLPNHIAEPKFAYKNIAFNVGYCASEVTDNGEVSQKSDVYSFGVVLLELLTGKTTIFQDEFTCEKVNLARWILAVVEDELTSQVFDLDLLRYENVEEDLVRMLQIAIDCTAHNPYSRPSMAKVRSQIEELRPASS